MCGCELRQPRRAAVVLRNELSVFARLPGRSPRGAVSATEPWNSLVDVSLSWDFSDRGALSSMQASFKFDLSPYLVSRQPWQLSTRSSFVAIGVCLGLMSAPLVMQRRKVLRWRFAMGCRELASEVGRVSKRTRCKRNSRSVRARSRSFGALALDAMSEYSRSEEDERGVAYTTRESCWLPRGVVPTPGSRDVEIGGWHTVVQDENSIIVQECSILYAVSAAEKQVFVLTPPDYFRQSCAGAPQRTLNTLNIAFSHASNPCNLFPCRVCLVFQVDTRHSRVQQLQKKCLSLL